MLRGSRTGKSGDERTKGGISRALPVGGVIRPKGAVRRRVRYQCQDLLQSQGWNFKGFVDLIGLFWPPKHI